MHEVAIAQGLLQIVKEQVALYGAQKVTKVKVKVGALSGVLPEALELAFTALSRGEVTEGATLEVEVVPVRVKCESCGVLEEVPFLVCPNCGGLVEMLSGRELQIESLEIEDGGQGS